MSKHYFHPSTQSTLELLKKDLPQALLVAGPVGVGLSAVHAYLGGDLGVIAQVILPEKDEKVDIEKGVISVDSVRRIYDMTKTIETGKRLIVIDFAERMGVQAQNAFLKLLEEPGKNTHFMLLTHEPAKLLPTIHSRVQQFDVRRMTESQSEQLLDEIGVKDQQKRSQLLFMASGLPAELSRLVSDERYFEARAQIVRDARTFLQGGEYDRLKLATTYKDDRNKALLLIDDTLKMLQRNIEQGKIELIPKVEKLLEAYQRLEANGNVRLQLAAAMV